MTGTVTILMVVTVAAWAAAMAWYGSPDQDTPETWANGLATVTDVTFAPFARAADDNAARHCAHCAGVIQTIYPAHAPGYVACGQCGARP